MKSILKILFLIFSINWCLVSALPDDCHCRIGTNKKIVRGRPSKYPIPWLVSIQSEHKSGDQIKQHRCSGIIIDDETIITIDNSACVSGLRKDELEIVVGLLELSEKNENNTFKVKEIIKPKIDHQQMFGPGNSVILKLETKLNLEIGKIEKACIRMFDSSYGRTFEFGKLNRRFDRISEQFTVTGFGFDQKIILDDGKLKPYPKPINHLKVADVRIDPKKTTEHIIYVRPKIMQKDSICAFDEGSPLMIQENGKTKVVAIADDLLVTFNPNKNKFCDGEGAFIKFSSLNDFIKENIDTNRGQCFEYSN